jgi:signal peptidase
MKKVLKKISYILVLVILGIIIVLNLCSLCNVSLFGYRIFKIATGSMEPYLKVGDIVLIKEDTKYGVSDVITYKENDVYITHRILYSEGDKIVTKGDANNVNDEPIKKSDVVGKVVLKLSFVTFISYLIGNPIVWGIAIVLCVILILIPTYRRKNGQIIDKEII